MATNISEIEHGQHAAMSPIEFATGPLLDAAEEAIRLCKRDQLSELSVSRDRGAMTYAITIRSQLHLPEAAITITRRPYHM